MPLFNPGAGEGPAITGPTVSTSTGSSGLLSNKKPSKRPANSDVVITLALELFGVWLFTLLAGASNDAGSIMILVMVALWLIFLIQHQSVVGGVGAAYAKIASGNA